ncbi:MAG: glycosyltransferase [Candidatus Lokiarchaeota archaeon]|nr:glycosyltransferase [Candidatus Lokiarchaeota archaeon]
MNLRVLHVVQSNKPPQFVVKDTIYLKKLANIDSEILLAPRYGSLKRLFLTIFQSLKAAMKIIRHRPDVIHFHFLSSTLPDILHFTPSIISIQESFSWYPKWWLAIFKILASRSKTVYISEHNRDMWTPTLKKKGRLIYHAVDASVFNPERYNPELRDQLKQELGIDYLIMLMGPFNPTRGYELAIKACQIIRKKGINAGIVFKGYGHGVSYKEKMVKLAEELEVPMKLVTRYLTEDELIEYYASSEVFIRPGIAEGFGIAVLEAQACGTPVIVTECCSLKEIFKDSSLKFRPFDQITLAEHLEALYHNESLREDMIQAGLKNAEYFSWDRKIAGYIKAYRDAIEESLLR